MNFRSLLGKLLKGQSETLNRKRTSNTNYQEKLMADKTQSWKIKIEEKENKQKQKKGLGELGFLKKMVPVGLLLKHHMISTSFWTPL